MPARGAYGRTTCPVQAPVPGEIVLIGALLRQAVHDARGEWCGTGSVSARAMIRLDAQAFLRDADKVGYWCALSGADVEVIQPQLLRAAQLTP
jgi:hypothetical protein